MASRHTLVRQICKILGVYQAGQDLSAEDYRAVDEELPYHLLALSRTDVFDAPSVDEIPDEAVTALARYLAEKYISAFGLVGEERARIEADAQMAERDLRYLRTMKPTYAPVRGYYF